MIWVTVAVLLGVFGAQVLPSGIALSLLILAFGGAVLCLILKNKLAPPLFALGLALARTLWISPEFFSISEGAAFAFLLPIRRFFIQALDALFGADNGFARGVLLGDTSEISRELMVSFQNNGLVHLLSVSGIHVSIIARSTKQISKPFPPWPRLFFRTFLVLAYVGITGFSSSAVRAALMLFGLWIAIPLRQQEDSPSAFLFSLAGTVFLMPQSWETVSFQLSFACMFGLLALNQPVAKLLRLPRGSISEIVSGTLAVTITMLPIFAYYFGGFSWISVFVSLLVLPVIPIVTLSGFFAMLLYPLLPSFAALIAAPAKLGLWGITKFMGLLDTTLLPLPKPHVIVIAVYLIGVLFLSPLYLPNQTRAPQRLFGLAIKKPSLAGLSILALSVLLWVVL